MVNSMRKFKRIPDEYNVKNRVQKLKAGDRENRKTYKVAESRRQREDSQGGIKL